MEKTIPIIHLASLASLLIPIVVVAYIYARWSLSLKNMIYAISRMIIQLTLVGFVLVALFQTDSWLILSSVLSVMLLVASWIAIRPVRESNPFLYPKAFLSLLLGCLPVLFFVIFLVLTLSPWYQPRFVIPIAGMIFSSGMNSVSLAAERFYAERQRNIPFEEARKAAFHAGLLPIINSFFAVGLVSLPGMMTGQILSGISPLIAVRYQIMVMGMLLASSGLSAAVYLHLQKNAH